MFAQEKGKADFPLKYKKWLEEEVVYIITPKEKGIFLQLETDRERDIFIDAFWKQRDPTPGTPRNEFKEEHYRRLAYANEFFGRGTPKPGWMTDQGRTYIVLGPPNTVDKYEDVMNVYPTQIWFYYGDPKYGLPPGFNVIFFKKGGSGEYVLFSPSLHGPQSLIADYMGTAKDAEEAYRELSRLQPNLARQTLSLIPGERVFPGMASLASETLLNNIFSYPQKKVEDVYAEALLKYKDIIEVDYTANYIGCDSVVKVLQHDSGIFFVHYSVEPQKLSVDRYGESYHAHFELDGRVTDQEGKTVFQFTREMPLSLSQEQLQSISSTSFALQDMFPLVSGRYKFDLLVKNTVSKEFTSLGTEVEVPDASSRVQTGSLILGYDVEQREIGEKELIPFRIEGKQILCQPRKTFAKKDSCSVFFQIFGLNANLRSQGALLFTFFKGDEEFLSKRKKIEEYGDTHCFIEEFKLESFVPGYYRLKVSLIDGEEDDVLSAFQDFEVTHVPDLPRPFVISKVTSVSGIEELEYIQGLQYRSLGNSEKARSLLKKAYRSNPSQQHFALSYSQVLFVDREYNRVKEVLLPFLEDSEPEEGTLYLLGKSSHSLGQYEEAISYYNRYLSRFGTNLEILNLLGTCYFKTGNSKEALRIWQKSLEISPSQENIKKLVESIKKPERAG